MRQGLPIPESQRLVFDGYIYNRIGKDVTWIIHWDRANQIVVTKVKISKDLVLSDDMKNIIISGKQRLFLKYDNLYKRNNRILVYYFDRVTQILKLSRIFGVDGT